MTEPRQSPQLPPVRLSEVEHLLRTGDLMLLHGVGRLSVDVEEITKSVYSHVGMIVRANPSTPPRVWQAGGEPVAVDPETGTKHGGAQLGGLAEVIDMVERHKETVYLRRLDLDRTPEFEQKVEDVIKKFDGTPFSKLWQLVLDWVLGLLHIPTSTNRFFCSELVARTYIEVGLLPPDPPANDYAPRDFSIENAHLPLLLGAHLREEFLIAPEPQVPQTPESLKSPA